jgi:hypothetical protein
MLPEHGKINCRACFTDNNNQAAPHPHWRMVNDPGAWGSNEPEYLVLGFSKGATQAGIFDTGRFEDVAFAKMRPRLTQALRIAGVLGKGETVDKKISSRNSNIAFGSLIRCSVTRYDQSASKKKGYDVFACSGALVTKSFDEIPEIIDRCSRRFLVGLPKSVKAVLFLSNTDQYVQGCQALLQKLFPADFRRINPMAVWADGRPWVHLAHPSGTNGHFGTWLESDIGPGQKRREALDALAE